MRHKTPSEFGLMSQVYYCSNLGWCRRRELGQADPEKFKRLVRPLFRSSKTKLTGP